MNMISSEDAMLQEAEAARYALLLEWGTRIGLAVLVLGFTAYVFGYITPLVPLEQLPGLWSQPVAVYLKTSGTPTGWNWLALVNKGDMLNLVGIAILAGCSMPPLLGLIPLYLNRHDHAYVAICAAIILVLVLAASGVLGGGH
jgi:hypothetical protein